MSRWGALDETKVKTWPLSGSYVGGSLRRAGIEWSAEEDAIFEAGLIRNKSSREIADDLFIRTTEDVRSHLRALNKKEAQHNPPYPALSLRKPGRTGRRHPPPSAMINESDIASTESDSDSDTSSEHSNESIGILDSHHEEESSSEDSES